MIGRTVSHYTVIEKLGSGGMGVVYKAQDTRLDRTVALKFLPPHLGQSEQDKRRFLQEAKAASTLDHSNILTIHEIDETDEGQLFIAMAYYEGESLRDRIERGPLPVEEAVEIASQIARGLAHAHEHGIVHRDVKPANVILTKRGEAKLVDFGLARLAGESRLTQSGASLGTPAYMSPEQIRGDDVDHRSDIWSLGIVFSEMLTGHLPFRGQYEQAVIYSILNDEPEALAKDLPDAPPYLDSIVQAALKKDPSQRYATVGDLLHDLTAAQPASPSLPPVPVASRVRFFRRVAYAATGSVVAAVAIAAIVLLQPKAPVVDSIAVLPLENLSHQPDQEYFADGMTEALITDLAKVSALRVISRTSSMEYKGVRKPLAEIASELNVQSIVEGSVLRSDDRVRITARLIHAADDRQIWGESFDRDFKEILLLQSEVARTIADAIHVNLTSDEKERLESAGQVDPAAHEAYLKGMDFLHKGEVDAARDFFQKAIDASPEYALAYAGMADYFSLLPFYGNYSPLEVYPRAKTMALKALELDPNLSEAHGSLAYVQTYYERDWTAAENSFHRALELNPNNATVREMYSRFLSSMGRIEEARSQLEHAQVLDPLDLSIHANAGLISYFAREYERAVGELNATLDLDPNFSVAHWGLGMVYQQQKRYSDALPKLEEAVEQTHRGSNAIASLGHAYAEAGMREKAEQILEELLDKAKNRQILSYQIALVNVGLGRKDEAFEWLDKAYQDRSTLLLYAKMDPRLDAIRSDPRFGQLLSKIGLGG